MAATVPHPPLPVQQADELHINSTEKKDLLTLPPEVFERIAQSLPIEDLSALRLTCREADTKTQRTFFQAHFAESGFLLCSKESLRAAIDLVKHVKSGPAMKKIILYADSINAEPAQWFSSALAVPATRVQQDILKESWDRARESFAWHAEHVRETEDDSNLLTVLFARLTQRDQEVEVVVKTFFDSGPDRLPWCKTVPTTPSETDRSSNGRL